MKRPIKPKSLRIVKRHLSRKGRPYYGLATLEDGHARITINPALNKSPREMMNTAIHEATHIAEWLCTEKGKARRRDLREWEVDAIASNITAVLWRMGYRRVER